MKSEEESLKIRDKIIRFIGISKKTEFEVRQKLKRLNVTSFADINEYISYLKELGYINDEEYVISYIKQEERFLNYSIYEIKSKLSLKEIDKSLILKYTGNLEESDYENLVIQKLLNTKLKSYDENKKRAYLYRRGFKLNGSE